MRVTRTRHLVGALIAAGMLTACGSATAATPDPTSDEHDQPDTADALEAELDEVRDAVGGHDADSARAAGWQQVDGLDHCFEHPDHGGMGYHLIDTDQLDEPSLDPHRPEALVFVPDGDGHLHLGAVEYIVPTDLWDAPDPPSVFGHDLHVLEPVPGVEVWGLHVWLFEDNPQGTFADWNPQVRCPPQTATDADDDGGSVPAVPGRPGTIRPL